MPHSSSGRTPLPGMVLPTPALMRLPLLGVPGTAEARQRHTARLMFLTNLKDPGTALGEVASLLPV